LNGITNGEYIYAVFEILSEILSDEPYAETPLFKEAVLASLLDGLQGDFLDLLDSEEFPAETAQDIWNLYSACRRNRKAPLWENDKDEEVEPPILSEIERDDWERILEEIHDEFLWDRDWEIGIFGGTNFALLKEQPHFPTLQEYRTAKIWLQTAYSNTRHNRKSTVNK
jgi:hypothetical protein